MIVPIVQARMTSARFPGKILADFNGQPLLAHAVRAAWQGCGRPVIVAMPENADARLRQFCVGIGALVTLGDEQDVLGRFVKAARERQLEAEDVIVRITPDDPYKQPFLIWLAGRLVQMGARYADTNHAPGLTGFGAEAFTVRTLFEADHLDSDPLVREHVTMGIRQRYPAPAISASIDVRADVARLEAWRDGYLDG